MTTKLSWEKEFFKNTYHIFSQSSEIGELENLSWSAKRGKINGQEYLFETKGFFSQTTKITDVSKNTVIGQINYNSWKTKASIQLYNESYTWKYNNLWNTKWDITSKNDDTKIDFHWSSSKGEIKSNVQIGPLILIGLFITNYYWQTTTVALIAIFIPIFL